MRKLWGLVAIGAAVAAANAMVKIPERPAPVAQIDFARCNRLAEAAGAAMALRQIGTEESAAMRQASGDGLEIVSRAYAEPIAASGDAKALAARNFADSIKHECIRG
ncbi:MULTISPECIES: hypothetical protein [unclassified Mesorhizobium]|uniref:hypothetical protein n=1 Tax=unclassified Mesorhizobium TaxID=325217 RepID=UPI001093E486|nr:MULTISPECIES: hypothetical protein [unclassified Mesorhizobium]TGT90876.1 hypothetical protein EN804_05945 [Mesorhizobium sp. M8A.F.Ca.ET.161.01.1.1]TGV43844.1 hypothetical protein EN785_07600 [Mesorhizobium sp. M8A.F.Ca.ET.142.01.1.1]